LGDTIDRGDSAMRIIDTLIELKLRYPNRVALLMGNRDVNKLALRKKFAAEIEAGLPEIEYADQVVELKRFLEEINAGRAFDFRRKELERGSGRPVHDSEVFRSIVGDVAPEGRISRYLELSQVAYFHVETGGLFVHGGLGEKSLGHVPGHRNRFRNLKSWITALNVWAADLPADLMDYIRPRKETSGRNEYSII